MSTMAHSRVGQIGTYVSSRLKGQIQQKGVYGVETPLQRRFRADRVLLQKRNLKLESKCGMCMCVWVCVCACVCVRACLCVCMRACVRERA